MIDNLEAQGLGDHWIDFLHPSVRDPNCYDRGLSAEFDSSQQYIDLYHALKYRLDYSLSGAGTYIGKNEKTGEPVYAAKMPVRFGETKGGSSIEGREYSHNRLRRDLVKAIDLYDTTENRKFWQLIESAIRKQST